MKNTDNKINEKITKLTKIITQNITEKTTVKTAVKIMAVILAMASLITFAGDYVQAASNATPASVIDAIKDNVSSYPFEDSDEITSRRRVFGVSVKKLSSFKAYQKTTGKGNDTCEYMLFVGRAKSSAKARSAIKSLKNYVKNEKENMDNYLSSEGKSVFSNARAGRKGKWIWVLVVGSKDANDSASKAIKDNI
jgi:hypothetical protein